MAEEVLANEQLAPCWSVARPAAAGGLISLWKAMSAPAAVSVNCAGVGLHVVLRRLEGQVEHGEREHHLGEVAVRLGDVRGEERHFPPGGDPRGVIAPEGVDWDEIGGLLLDGQAVVIVLRPFLGRAELAVVGRSLGEAALVASGATAPSVSNATPARPVAP